VFAIPRRSVDQRRITDGSLIHALLLQPVDPSNGLLAQSCFSAQAVLGSKRTARW